MNLPEDLQRFLRDGQQLNFDPNACETGQIVLHALEDLKIEMFNLQTYASSLQAEDPHGQEGGYYHVPAISFVKECENFLPRFLLLYLPHEAVFGTGDEGHGHLQIFPGATWTDIAVNPVPYLEAQSNPEGSVGAILRPWPQYVHSDQWAE